MTTSCKQVVHLIFAVALLRSSIISYAQTTQLDPQKWATELNKKGKDGNESFRAIDSILGHLDSAQTFEFLSELSDKGKKTDYFQVRFNLLKAAQILIVRPTSTRQLTAEVLARKGEIQNTLANAMDVAYRTEDNHLIALASLKYARIMWGFGEIGLAVMYAMNAIDLAEETSDFIRPFDYQFLGEMLYRVREYNSSIKYSRKAADAWTYSADPSSRWLRVSCVNTMALGFHRQDKYDSAFFYYREALSLAREAQNVVWIGIISGNMAQIYYVQKQYDTAHVMFLNDYRTSKDSGFYDNAANSLQWAARTDLALGNKAAALMEVREAFGLLRLWPDAGYLRNAYYTATQIFKEMGNYDSAFYYNNVYSSLNDSLERVVSRSTSDIARARLNDEASRYRIQILNREKKSQLVLRNMIIAGIVLVLISVLLIFSRKSLKTKMKMEKIQQEKLLMEREAASAQDQLKLFTQNVVDKTDLIEKLEMQVKGKEVTSEQHSIMSELEQKTILTEQDWYTFKSLFEKIYPGFFIKLKDRFPDITVAEQRMAALTRLHLTTRQIASMLGISPASVHKSRQRLRQRFQVGPETNLEELVANL